MTSATWSSVESLIEVAESGGGSVGVSLDVSGETVFEHNGSRRFRSASTVKIPIMIEVFRMIEHGTIALSDHYEVQAADQGITGGVLPSLHIGLSVTINDLVYLMMSISDNIATNILIDKAGMKDVNALMTSLGMETSTLGRKMQGFAATSEQHENWATPDEYAALMRKLLGGETASAESTMAMTAMLEGQQNMRRIGRYVNEIDGVRWGSKTGSITGVANDVGFVETLKGTLIASVFCEDLKDMYTGEQFIGDVVREALITTGLM